MKRIVFIIVFSSFTIGKMYGQCDTFKYATIDIRVITGPPAHVEEIPQEYDPNNPPQSLEWRRIYFIHGLGGDKSAWEQAGIACQYNVAQGFPARKCETTRLDYVKSTSSLLSAADDVRKGIRDQANNDRRDYYNLNPNMLNPARAILIAHSQGGMVTRELMHLDFVADSNNPLLKPNGQMNYGGVVTIASPLQGAAILNHRSQILNMANDGCSKLTRGPEYEVVNMIKNLPWVVELFITEGEVRDWLKNKLNNITDTICKTVANTAMPMFFKDYYKGITNNYLVGSDTIKTLNNDANNAQYRNFPKMAFYAVEPPLNIFWRTLNWMVKNPNDEFYFQANGDWDFYDNTIKPMIDKYQAKCETYQKQHDAYYLTCMYAFGMGAYDVATQANKYRTYAATGLQEWQKGLEWFNKINLTWEIIIGARYFQGTNITYNENDGVVLARSANNMPCATHSPVRICPNENSTVDVEKGSSHMQVRNDRGLKNALFELFEGHYDWWFATAKQ